MRNNRRTQILESTSKQWTLSDGVEEYLYTPPNGCSPIVVENADSGSGMRRNASRRIGIAGGQQRVDGRPHARRADIRMSKWK